MIRTGPLLIPGVCLIALGAAILALNSPRSLEEGSTSTLVGGVWCYTANCMTKGHWGVNGVRYKWGVIMAKPTPYKNFFAFNEGIYTLVAGQVVSQWSSGGGDDCDNNGTPGSPNSLWAECAAPSTSNEVQVAKAICI